MTIITDRDYTGRISMAKARRNHSLRRNTKSTSSTLVVGNKSRAIAAFNGDNVVNTSTCRISFLYKLLFAKESLCQ